MKAIAVLLTVHNRKLNTLACLEYLFAQQEIDKYKVDVYLTDDGCTDGTPQAISQLFPTVNIIVGNGFLFWNRGMHKAWEAASKEKDYDFYLWLNDDTLLESNALRALLYTADVTDNSHIVIGTTCSSENNFRITYGGRSRHGKFIQPMNEFQTCIYFNGNIVLIPKLVYQKVGMNDPVFHHGLGDFDYGLRAATLGIKSFVARGILGKCDTHEHLATWCNPSKRFKVRWRAFRTPIGQNPEEHFIFEKRHKGVIMAVFHYITNHIRVFCPNLWKLKNI